jgi:hypothetical protein
LQDWNTALEDTLLNLIRTGLLGDVVAKSPSTMSRPVVPGLSSPNMKVLAVVASKLPARLSMVDARRRECSGTFDGPSQLQVTGQNKEFSDSNRKARTRIEKLERELQDLTENFVKEMCILKDENSELRAKTQENSAKGSISNEKESSAPNELRRWQTTFEDTIPCQLKMQLELQSLQIEALTAQLHRKEQELQKSQEVNEELHRKLQDRSRELQKTLKSGEDLQDQLHGSKQQLQSNTTMLHIDEQLDEALWLLKELSLDRAHSSLERVRASESLKRLHDLHQMVHRPCFHIPQVRLHDLETPNISVNAAENNFGVRNDVGGKCSPQSAGMLAASGDCLVQETKAAGKAVHRASCIGLKKTSEISTALNKNPLHKIMEEPEAAFSPNAALSQSHVQSLTVPQSLEISQVEIPAGYVFEPEEPPFPPSLSSLSFPFMGTAGTYHVASYRQKSGLDHADANVMSSFIFHSGNGKSEEQVVLNQSTSLCETNQAAPERPPRTIHFGNAKVIPADIECEEISPTAIWDASVQEWKCVNDCGASDPNRIALTQNLSSICKGGKSNSPSQFTDIQVTNTTFETLSAQHEEQIAQHCCITEDGKFKPLPPPYLFPLCAFAVLNR